MLNGSGVSINGPQPWDIQVKNSKFFKRVLLNGSLGFGESYMDGWWECEKLDEMINLVMRAHAETKTTYISHVINRIHASIFNLQKKSRAFVVGEKHYDVGNDLYKGMLGKRMVYTCGYWANANNLDDAQYAKLDLICRKLDIQKGMKILDIGCGWGSFARFAAENYGAQVVGITISKEQAKLGTEHCKSLPVEIRLQDYRDLDEKFDAIVSIGMFEHVGHKNYKTYMQVAERCLNPEGKFLLHTIGKFDSIPGVDPWTARYIFPNGQIPSLKQISESLEGVMLVEDLHNFGPDYDKTLMSWFDNFNRIWPEIKENYSERFYRMWKYYLHVCAGAFRARDLHLWQFVLSKDAPYGAYRRPE